MKARLYDWLGYPVEVVQLPPGRPPRIVIRGSDAYVREADPEDPKWAALGKIDYHQATCWVCVDTIELIELGSSDQVRRLPKERPCPPSETPDQTPPTIEIDSTEHLW